MLSELYEWDDEKAEINRRIHGISFVQATDVFTDPLAATFDDDDHSDGEARFITIGSPFFNQVLVVSHTARGERIRIISARRATSAERRIYMNKPTDLLRDDDLRPEYDFDYSKAEIGKFYRGRGRIVVVVPLDEDVLTHYTNATQVNEALRMLIAEGRAPEPRKE